jgi:hypothetical protein
MIKPKKSTLVAVAAVTLGMGLAGAGIIKAASTTTTQANPMASLVNAIATKFNLNTSDVQQVFDDQHAQMQAQRLDQYKTRLATAVTNGKLTQDQADKIIAKVQELQTQREANRDSMEGKTIEERRQIMQQEMTSLKQWATDNNIPMEYLRFGMGGKGPGHRGMMDGKGPGPDQDADQQTNQ